MKRTNLIAIVLIAVMALSVVSAAGATAAKRALQPAPFHPQTIKGRHNVPAYTVSPIWVAKHPWPTPAQRKQGKIFGMETQWEEHVLEWKNINPYMGTPMLPWVTYHKLVTTGEFPKPPPPKHPPKSAYYCARLNAAYVKAGYKLLLPFYGGYGLVLFKKTNDAIERYDGTVSKNGVREFVSLYPAKTLKDALNCRDQLISTYKALGYHYKIIKNKNGVSYWYGTHLWVSPSLTGNGPPTKWRVTIMIGVGRDDPLGGRPTTTVLDLTQYYK